MNIDFEILSIDCTINTLIFFQTKALWDWAVPILRSGLNNLTVSTVNDWSSFYTNVSVSIH